MAEALAELKAVPDRVFALMVKSGNVKYGNEQVGYRVAVHGVMECDRTAADVMRKFEQRDRRQGPDGRSEGGLALER